MIQKVPSLIADCVTVNRAHDFIGGLRCDIDLEYLHDNEAHIREAIRHGHLGVVVIHAG